MAESVASHTILQRTLECPVCLLMYDRNDHQPKSLRCGHTLCKSCVDELQEQSVIRCPKCRRDSNLHSVKINFMVTDMLDALCSDCKRKEREIQCPKCDEYVCLSCSDPHLKVHSLQTDIAHRVEDLSEDIDSILSEYTSKIENEQIKADIVLRRIREACRTSHDVIDRCQRQCEKKVCDINESNIDSLTSWRNNDRNLDNAKKLMNEAESSLNKTPASSNTLIEEMVRLSEDFSRVKEELNKSRDCFPKVVNYHFKEAEDAISMISNTKRSDVGEIISSVSTEEASGNHTKYTVKHMTGEDELCYPCGVVVNNDGYIIVADSDNHRLNVYDRTLKNESTFGTRGKGAGQFNYPLGVAVAPDGKVYVSDSRNNRIQVLTMEGHDVVTCDLLNIEHIGWSTSVLSMLREFLSSVGFYKLKQPQGVAFDRCGNLYICDSANYRVQVVANGAHERTVGSQWTFDGQPLYVTVTQDQKVLVSEEYTNVIKVFDTSGTFVETYPKNAPTTLSDMRPRGLATDHVGNIIIADEEGRIVVLDKDGGYMCVMFSTAVGSEQMKSPEGVVVDGFGNILVNDIATHRLNMVTIGN